MNRWGLEFEPIGQEGAEMARLHDGLNLYYHPKTNQWWLVDMKRLADTSNVDSINEAIIRDWLVSRLNQTLTKEDIVIPL